MKKLVFLFFLFLVIFLSGCNPIDTINIERGGLQFLLPEAKRSLPVQDDVVLYRITVMNPENGFQQVKEGIPGQIIIFDNLLPGNYDVTVLAFNDSKDLIFQGSAEGIEVIPGIIKQVIIYLNYSTGGIEISIIFPETDTPIPAPTETLEPETPSPTQVAPTQTPTPSPIPEGAIWIMPETLEITAGSAFITEIHLDSRFEAVHSFGFFITYNKDIIEPDISVGDRGVEKGPDSFQNILANSKDGELKITGFDTNGTGPEEDLYLIKINWLAKNPGVTSLDLTVDKLTNQALIPISVNNINTAVTVIPPEPSKNDPGSVWMVPENYIAYPGEQFKTEIHLNSGNESLNAFGINITYDPSIVKINEAVGNKGVQTSNDSTSILLANSLHIPEDMLKVTGMEIETAVGPGSDLSLFTINWIAITPGTSKIRIIVDQAVNGLLETIGNPFGIEGMISVE